MDDARFDTLTKFVATRPTRRRLLKTLAGIALGGGLSRGGATIAAPSCRGAGHPCEGHQTCCDGLICTDGGPGTARRCASAPCPSGTSTCHGQCVPSCAGGQILDPSTCACGCPSGTTPCGGACVTACAGGAVLDPNTCQCTCPAGTTACGGTCVSACPDGQVLNPDTCACACASGGPPCGGTCCAAGCHCTVTTEGSVCTSVVKPGCQSCTSTVDCNNSLLTCVSAASAGNTCYGTPANVCVEIVACGA